MATERSETKPVSYVPISASNNAHMRATRDDVVAATRTSFDHREKRIEHSVMLYRSDRVRFSISQRQRKSAAGDWVLTARGPRGSESVRATLAANRIANRTTS